MALSTEARGYRALAINGDRVVQPRSRNNNEFNDDYPGIPQAFAALPNDTVVDGEVVAFDDCGHRRLTSRKIGPKTASVFYDALASGPPAR